MKVNNLISQLSTAASLTKRNTPTAALSAASQTITASPLSTGNSPAAQQILASYDVSNITPNQFSQMIQKLFDAGAISQKDLQDLSGVRADLELAGVGADETVNLPQFYAKKIQAVQDQAADANSAASQQQLSPLLRRLDWMEKFQAAKAEPNGGSLSAIA